MLAACGWAASAGLAVAQPVFTGDAAADFAAAGAMTVFAPDGSGDVGLPPACPGVTASGWDLAGVWWFYDRSTDTLYVGLDSRGILGDVDGDGNPATTDPCVASQGGIDFADFGGTEAAVVGFDLDLDGIVDFAAGVDGSNTVAGFGVSRTGPGDPLPFAVSLGDPRPGLVQIAANNTSAAMPDMEFAIGPIASMYGELGLPFSPNADPSGLIFNFTAFCGGFLDDGIGEDNVTPTQLAFVCIGWDNLPDGSALDGSTAPGALVTTEYSGFGVTVSGMSHSGNPGAFAYNTVLDPTTDDQIPPLAPYASQPNVLFTRRAPGTTDSDDGRIDFGIVSPFDGAAWTASYADILVIDVEDSGPRGNANITATFAVGAPQTIPVPDTGNNGYFSAVFSADCEDGITGIIADLGDSEDSAATDVLCFNLCPRRLPLSSATGDSSDNVSPGGRFEMNVHVENVAHARRMVEWSVRLGRPGQPLSDWQTVKGPRTRPVPAGLDKDVLLGVRIPEGTAPGDAFVAVVIRDAQGGTVGSVITNAVVKTIID